MIKQVWKWHKNTQPEQQKITSDQEGLLTIYPHQRPVVRRGSHVVTETPGVYFLSRTESEVQIVRSLTGTNWVEIILQIVTRPKTRWHWLRGPQYIFQTPVFSVPGRFSSTATNLSLSYDQYFCNRRVVTKVSIGTLSCRIRTTVKGDYLNFTRNQTKYLY